MQQRLELRSAGNLGANGERLGTPDLKFGQPLVRIVCDPNLDREGPSIGCRYEVDNLADFLAKQLCLFQRLVRNGLDSVYVDPLGQLTTQRHRPFEGDQFLQQPVTSLSGTNIHK